MNISGAGQNHYLRYAWIKKVLGKEMEALKKAASQQPEIEVLNDMNEYAENIPDIQPRENDTHQSLVEYQFYQWKKLKERREK